MAHMFVRIFGILQNLIDGTSPLPPPFPPQLNFFKNEALVRRVAGNLSVRIANDDLQLSDVELRYLVFKMASYLRSTKRHSLPINVAANIDRVWPAITLALRENPKWLSSPAGVQWACENYNMWLHRLAKQARTECTEPARVADLEGNPGFYFVELTTGAHIHDEGIALGHCMSWSMNREAAWKHSSPLPGSPLGLECLTYAVKVRHGELRVFSLRGPRNVPLMTITYSPEEKCIRDTMGIHSANYFGWTVFTCAMIRSLSSVVEMDFSRVMHSHGCYRHCSGAGWCQGRIRNYDELTAFRHAEGMGGGDVN